MTNSRAKGGDGELAALIRGQLRDASNRQFLSRMPVFRADNDGEDMFDDLLARLDRAETKRGRQ